MATATKRTANANTKGTGVAPKFQAETSQALGPYGVGEFLTRDRDLADYFRLALNEGKEEAEHTALTDAQIVAAVKSVKTDGMTASEADVERITYLEGLSPDVLDADMVPPMESLMSTQAGTNGLALGAMVDDAFQNRLTKAVDGKKDYDSCPVAGKYDLERMFKDKKTADGTPVLQAIPLVNTKRFTDQKKGIRGPGWMTQEQWKASNLPTDYYRDPVTDKARSFVEDFTAGMPKFKPYAVEINQLKAAASADMELPANTPDDIRALKADKTKAAAMLATKQSDWRNLVNRVRRSLQFYQAEQYLLTRFPGKVEVALSCVDEDENGVLHGLEEAYRSTKPVCLRNPRTKKEGAPMTLTAFINLKAWNVPTNTALPIPALMSVTKRGKKTETILPKEADNAARIKTTNELAAVLNTAFQYLDTDGTNSAIMAAIGKPDGGRIAFELMCAFDNLRPYGENATIRKLGEAWNKSQLEGRVASEQAASEIAADKNKAA